MRPSFLTYLCGSDRVLRSSSARPPGENHQQSASRHARLWRPVRIASTTKLRVTRRPTRAMSHAHDTYTGHPSLASPNAHATARRTLHNTRGQCRGSAGHTRIRRRMDTGHSRSWALLRPAALDRSRRACRVRRRPHASQRKQQQQAEYCVAHHHLLALVLSLSGTRQLAVLPGDTLLPLLRLAGAADLRAHEEPADEADHLDAGRRRWWMPRQGGCTLCVCFSDEAG